MGGVYIYGYKKAKRKKTWISFSCGAISSRKRKLIDLDKHLVLKSVHPSPLSAYNGFFGCKHFSKTNNYLEFTNKVK